MNAVEVEEAVSALAERPFDPEEFLFSFLEAFGNKATTIKRLRAGASNKSDLGGILQTKHVHIAVSAPGEVTNMLATLRVSPATARAKAKFVLATDGDTFEAEDVETGETVACVNAGRISGQRGGVKAHVAARTRRVIIDEITPFLLVSTTLIRY